MGIKMFRKRYIPNEVIDISNDEVLYMDDNVLVTKWLPIKPRKDIGRGLSFTFLKEGPILSSSSLRRAVRKALRR